MVDGLADQRHPESVTGNYNMTEQRRKVRQGFSQPGPRSHWRPVTRPDCVRMERLGLAAEENYRHAAAACEKYASQGMMHCPSAKQIVRWSVRALLSNANRFI